MQENDSTKELFRARSAVIDGRFCDDDEPGGPAPHDAKNPMAFVEVAAPLAEKKQTKKKQPQSLMSASAR